MLTALVNLLVYIHVAATVLLAIYALHQAVLLMLYWAHHKEIYAPPSGVHCPTVTIQIPLYNEPHVAQRGICAAAHLDYPRHLLHIQILDDSTDDTLSTTQTTVGKLQQLGINIEHIHRANRQGYKAGALAAGLQKTESEFIAIFDADFVPSPNFLYKTLAAFDNPKIGFVQTRWAHLNASQNSSTRAQAMMLDLHFVVEQTARYRAGLLMAFNGSGGVWRRSCIQDAGGWQTDTLTEDLDLSYRAQLQGWRGVFLVDETVPSEVPSNVAAYKLQQARWSRGTVQCARKLLPRIWCSHLPAQQKIFATLHITGYTIHPLMLVSMVLTPALLLLSAKLPTGLAWLSLLSVVPMTAMLAAQTVQGHSVAQALRDLPHAILLGIGVAWSNTHSMVRGLFGKQSGEFKRTPKGYAQPSNEKSFLLGELVLFVGGIAVVGVLVWRGFGLAALPSLLYACSFGRVFLGQMVKAKK